MWRRWAAPGIKGNTLMDWKYTARWVCIIVPVRWVWPLGSKKRHLWVLHGGCGLMGVAFYEDIANEGTLSCLLRGHSNA
jgi:alpha-D-ribose 1-methylphosphonate 5-phosphate C-P lyase